MIIDSVSASKHNQTLREFTNIARTGAYATGLVENQNVSGNELILAIAVKHLFMRVTWAWLTLA